MPKSPKESPDVVARLPIMSLAEITNIALVVEQFTTSPHFKDVPQYVREPIESGLVKLKGVEFGSKKPLKPRPKPQDRLPKRKKA